MAPMYPAFVFAGVGARGSSGAALLCRVGGEPDEGRRFALERVEERDRTFDSPLSAHVLELLRERGRGRCAQNLQGPFQGVRCLRALSRSFRGGASSSTTSTLRGAHRHLGSARGFAHAVRRT